MDTRSPYIPTDTDTFTDDILMPVDLSLTIALRSLERSVKKVNDATDRLGHRVEDQQSLAELGRDLKAVTALMRTVRTLEDTQSEMEPNSIGALTGAYGVPNV